VKALFARLFQNGFALLCFAAVCNRALLLLFQSFLIAHLSHLHLLVLFVRESLLRMFFTLRPQILLGFSLLVMQFTNEMTIHSILASLKKEW
jgi:hypothetical protein